MVAIRTRSMESWLVVLAAACVPAAAAQAQGLPHTFSAGTPARADEVNANFRYVAPRNVVFVAPAEGETAAAAGAALREALDVDNLTAIGGAPTADNPYLVKVAPGLYDLGTTGARVPSFVTLEGAGPHTRIVGAVVSPSSPPFAAALELADQSIVRDLHLENSSSLSVTVLASGGQVRLERVTVQGGGSTTKIATYLTGDTEATLVDCRVEIQSSSGQATGILLEDTAVLAIRDSIVRIEHSGVRAVGIEHIGSFVTQVVDTHVEVSNQLTTGGTEAVALVVGAGRDAVVRNSHLQASGGAAPFPVFAVSDSSVRVFHSRLLGGIGATGRFLRNTGGTVRIGASQLSTGTWDGTGTVSCIYSYLANATAATCSSAPL